MTTTAYLRVSTDAQEESSQRQQIGAWAKTVPIQVDAWIIDRASGAVPWQERGIAQVLRDAAEGDSIVVSEISRIARSITGVLSFLEAAVAAGVIVRAVRGGLTLDGGINSRIWVTVLGLAAEIERDLIRERTRAALAARRARGERLGRPIGSRGASKCAPYAADIARLLAARVSVRAIARVIGVAPSTVRAWIADNKQQTPPTSPS